MSHPSKLVTATRIALFSFFAALLSGAVTLFISIAVMFIISVARHGMLDLPFAYRRIAPTVAIVMFVVALVFVTRMEVRQYRRERDEEVIRPGW